MLAVLCFALTLLFVLLTYEAVRAGRAVSALLWLLVSVATGWAGFRTPDAPAFLRVAARACVERLPLTIIVALLVYAATASLWPLWFGRRELERRKRELERRKKEASVDAWATEQRRTLACVSAFAPLHFAVYWVLELAELAVRGVRLLWSKLLAWWLGRWKGAQEETAPAKSAQKNARQGANDTEDGPAVHEVEGTTIDAAPVLPREDEPARTSTEIS